MFLKEFYTGTVRSEANLSRIQYERAFIFIMAMGLILYSVSEKLLKGIAIVSEPRVWFAMVLLFILALSYVNDDIKHKFSTILARMPFVLAPSAFLTLYAKNLDPGYAIFFLVMYSAMAFLFSTKKIFWIYIFIYGLGVAIVLALLPDPQSDKLVVLYVFVGLTAVIWVVGNSFIWSQRMLSYELNKIEELNYLNSHRLRAHVARIIGLNQLVKLGEKEAREPLVREMEAMEAELRKMQALIEESPQVDVQYTKARHSSTKDGRKRSKSSLIFDLGLFAAVVMISYKLIITVAESPLLGC